MHDYKDPTRRTMVAVACVAIYGVLELLRGLALAYDYATAPDYWEPFTVPSDVAAVPAIVMLLVCYVVVGMWIHRASANAHSISDEMTDSPGWAVGWYFVPIMNLFKPYQTMREIWLASHLKGNWHAEPAPGLLGWWWGLWIVSNILGNISFQIAIRADSAVPSREAMLFDLVSAAVMVPACVILIVIMRAIARAQDHARHQETFA